MGHAFDLVIRAGRIVDGTGRVEIDARGAIATPGFVDIHAHYDGQVTWESFPEYLSFLAGRRYDMDICGSVPHAALRVYVMGARGANREPATPADIARMAELMGEAIDAGAMGFSTSLSLLHRSIDGASTPTYGVAGRELMALAMVLRQRGRGAMQVIVDFDAPGEAFGMLRRLAADSGRPLSFSLFEGVRHLGPLTDDSPEILDTAVAADREGVRIRAQVMGRAVGMLFGHELTLNPFYSTSTYRELASLPHALRVARLQASPRRRNGSGRAPRRSPTASCSSATAAACCTTRSRTARPARWTTPCRRFGTRARCSGSPPAAPTSGPSPTAACRRSRSRTGSVIASAERACRRGLRRTCAPLPRGAAGGG